jgi:hypothetical protein
MRLLISFLQLHSREPRVTLLVGIFLYFLINKYLFDLLADEIVSFINLSESYKFLSKLPIEFLNILYEFEHGSGKLTNYKSLTF